MVKNYRKFLAVFLSMVLVGSALAQSCPGGGTSGLPKEFVSMTFEQLGGTHNPTSPMGSSRMWNSPSTWPVLNTAFGTYNWTQFDNYMTEAKNLGEKDILFTLGRTPSWAVASTCSGPESGGSPPFKSCTEPARDIGTTDLILKTFATALATHCKNHVSGVKCIYEGWNEPDIAFNGSIAQLLTIQKDYYQSIIAVDPSAQVTSPAPSTINKFGVHTLPALYAIGGAAYQNVVAIHGYIYDCAVLAVNPEGGSGCSGGFKEGFDQLVALMALYHISSQPIFITEVAWGGAPNNANLTNQQKKEWMGRDIMYAWMNGVTRHYWYAWDNSQWGTLFNGSLTVAGIAHEQLYSWLVGETHSPGQCNQAGDKTWTCNLILANKAVAQIWFNPTTTLNKSVSATFNHFRTLDNATINNIVGNQISVNGSPTLVTP